MKKETNQNNMQKTEVMNEKGNEIKEILRENEILKSVLVNMLMQKELLEVKACDSKINSLEDMDLVSYFALRNQNIPVDIAVSALSGVKKIQPSTGDIKQAQGFQKQNKYKEMSRGDFLKEIEKAMRGELM